MRLMQGRGSSYKGFPKAVCTPGAERVSKHKNVVFTTEGGAMMLTSCCEVPLGNGALHLLGVQACSRCQVGLGDDKFSSDVRRIAFEEKS
jgi:hypothetical protein